MEEIGRRLQATRLAKGLTLQDVEDETRIRKKYIEALESGRISDIPGEVYVKGFLRSYGNFLGLDGEALVEEFKARSTPPPEPGAREARQARGNWSATAAAEDRPVRPRPAPRRTTEPGEGAGPAAQVDTVGERLPRRPASRPRPAPSSTYLFRRVGLALALLLPLAGAGWWLFGALTAAPQEAPPPATRQEAPPPKASEPPAVTNTPAPEPPRPSVTMTGPKGEEVAFTVSVSPVVVQVESFREGFPWMRVLVDGQVKFEGFPKGPLSFEGKEVTLRFGYADGVDLVINGQRFTAPLKGGPYNVRVTGK